MNYRGTRRLIPTYYKSPKARSSWSYMYTLQAMFIYDTCTCQACIYIKHSRASICDDLRIKITSLLNHFTAFSMLRRLTNKTISQSRPVLNSPTGGLNSEEVPVLQCTGTLKICITLHVFIIHIHLIHVQLICAYIAFTSLYHTGVSHAHMHLLPQEGSVWYAPWY